MWNTRQVSVIALYCFYVASPAPDEDAIICDRKIPLSTKMSFLAFPTIAYSPGKIQP
jgi:hypothetical protein